MNTWTSKTGICLFVCFGLSACETLPISKLGFAPVLNSQKNEGRVFRSAEMLNGQFTLVPPDDYCIDGDSLTQTFALMADCTLLANETSEFVDETDVLTASFSATAAQDAATVQSLTAALAPLKVRNGYVEQAVAYVEVTDPKVQPALDPVHWRGILQHQGKIIGFASYAPKGLNASPALIRKTAQNFIENNTGPADNQRATGALKSNLMSIVGLFQ